MMKFENATQAMHRDVQRRVFAAMETGNFDAARLELEEYRDVWPEQAQALCNDVIQAYGLTL